MLFERVRGYATVVLGVTIGTMLGLVPASFAYADVQTAPVTVFTAAAAQEAQQLTVLDVAAPEIKRDSYSVTEAPKPEPVVVPTPVLESPPPSATGGPVVQSTPGGYVVWPFYGGVRISDGWGPRGADRPAGTKPFHDGTDYLPGVGQPVLAIAEGDVIGAVNSDVGLGVTVTIVHTIDGVTVKSVYAHMQWGSLAVSAGQHVYAGQQVGLVGETGLATGPHLHFELWINGSSVDSYTWLQRKVG